VVVFMALLIIQSRKKRKMITVIVSCSDNKHYILIGNKLVRVAYRGISNLARNMGIAYNQSLIGNKLYSTYTGVN